MENSPPIAAMLAVALSVFFFGSIIVRDCSGIKQHKEELNKIKQEYKDMNKDLEALYKGSRARQDSIYFQIEQAYLKLDTVQQTHAARTRSINTRRRTIKKQNKGNISGFQFDQ